MVSVDVKHHVYLLASSFVVLYVHKNRMAYYGQGKEWDRAELRSSMKVEVAVLGSPSLTSLMVSADVKQH